MNKTQKRLRDSACVALALFEVFAFSGCSNTKEEKSDTIPYSQYITEKYGIYEKNFYYPVTFKDLQIWVTNLNGEFSEEYVEISCETLFEAEGLKRMNVVDNHSGDILASVLYDDNDDLEGVLNLLKSEFAKKYGEVVFVVNYYDVVKRLFGEKSEYTDSEIQAVKVYIDDYIELKKENIK